MKKNHQKSRFIGIAVLLLGAALLFGGSDMALILDGQKIFDATSITAIALILLGILAMNFEKE